MIYPGLAVTVQKDFAVPPETKVILGLGKPSLAFMGAQGLVPKGRTITSLRGILRTWQDVPLLLSYSPDVGGTVHAFYIDLLTDVNQAIHLMETGSMKPVYGDYRYVENFSEIVERVKQLYAETGKPVDATLDLETVGLDPLRLPSNNPPHPGAYIVSCQLSCEIGKSDVVYFTSRANEESRLAGVVGTQLGWWMNTSMIKLKGANLKFDLGWLAVRAKLYATNFVFDTTMVGSLLDENRSNGLDVHTKLYAPALHSYSDEFDKTVDKSRMDLVPKEKLLPYAGGDSDANLRVAIPMREELLKDPKLTAFYINILHPASRAFEQIEQGGVLVDLNAMNELRSDLDQELLETTRKAKRLMSGRIVAKHWTPSRTGEINLTKPSLLRDFMFDPHMGLGLTPKMFTEKDKDPSTSLDHMMMFAQHPQAGPFIELLSDYAKAAKIKSTYVGEVGLSGFLKYLRSDGRLHPSYWLFAGDKSAGEGGTNCMPAGQLVLTNRGYLPIERVCTEDQVITHKGRARPVLSVMFNGVKPLVRVTMSNGLVLSTTENHAYRIGDGWVEAANLIPGMQAWAHSGVEEWEPIKGWEDFLISSWGRVFNKKTQNFRKQSPKGDWGHLKVCLTRNGAQHRGKDRKDFAVHKLVANAFLERLGRTEVRHLNGYAWDNTVGNLEWGTSLENSHDAVRQGTMCRRHGSQNRLTEESVAFIRSVAPYWNNRELADKLGVSRELVRDVRNDKRWKPSTHTGKVAKFKPVTVVKVETLPAEMTYGLMVEDDHSHVTGGIVTHNTGRISARDPAFQVLIKHGKWAKQIRRCYPAPPGYVVVERDYSSGELRVVADIACETNMLQAFKDGQDIHVKTAAPFAGYTYESLMALAATDQDLFDETRQLGKAGNFGLVYGMGEDGFIEYAYSTYKVALDKEKAHDFRESYFQTYPQLLVYHDEYKRFARKHAWVRSPLGRIRHLPLIRSLHREIAAKAERNAINSPVQSTLSDMLLWTLAIEHAMGLTKIAPSFGSCHDAAYNYCPEDKVDTIVPQQIEIMQNLPFEKVGWKPKLNFSADAKVGATMGDVQKYKVV